MKQLISFLCGIIVAVLIGFAMFWIIHDPTITTHATQATETTSKQSESQEVESSTEPSETEETTSQEQESDLQPDGVSRNDTATSGEPSAQVPAWYDEAESYVPSYDDMQGLAETRNSTFPLDTATEGMATAIACMAQIPENDGSYMADMLRAMMSAKGYPQDKTMLVEDLITRAFHQAGWQTAPNEDGYVQP